MGIKVCLGGGRGKSVSGEGREGGGKPWLCFQKVSKSQPRASACANL